MKSRMGYIPYGSSIHAPPPPPFVHPWQLFRACNLRVYSQGISMKYIPVYHIMNSLCVFTDELRLRGSFILAETLVQNGTAGRSTSELKP